jgi:hypothetical protein
MSNPSANSESRLDRIERIVESNARAANSNTNAILQDAVQALLETARGTFARFDAQQSKSEDFKQRSDVF